MVATVNSTGTSTGVVITPDSSGVLALQTGGTTAITVDTSQNVGIGTSSPAAKLDVNVSSGVNLQLTKTTGAALTFSDGAIRAALQGLNGSDGLGFTTGSSLTERMRIDSSGNLLVGTTSALNLGKFSLLFDEQSVVGATLKSSNASTGGSYMYFVNSAGSLAGNIAHTGTTTVAYNASSDYRLKENIAPITDALNRVSKLKPVTYSWKNTDGEVGEGFIAHELQEVCPLAVTGEKDALNEDGSIKAQGIDTAKLVGLLTAALQETKALIDTQAETINALTARIVALEGK